MFAPTDLARQNLLNEGRDPARILVTGNTVIDALQIARGVPCRWEEGPLRDVSPDKRTVLVTAHRRESFRSSLREICFALSELASRLFPLDVQFVLPVHMNLNVRAPVQSILGSSDNMLLLPPLGYLDMVNLMCRSELVLTDSGGLQEEAPAVGVPVLAIAR
jgi:UDP-N-acetylglucosamine 2-epimerase (non-hydrolysing)